MLLGTANLVFWPIFLAAQILPVGYITTWLHWLFAGLQLFAAVYVNVRGHSDPLSATA